MFAPICNYKSQSFYEKHPFGIVYTPDGCAYQAEFFAGVIISGKDDSELYTNDFIDEAIFDEYIRQIKSSSTFNSDVEIEFGDKILAMVTCSYEQQNYRYVLYAKLNKQLIYKPEVVPTKELNK